jgi:hypothetical protein
MNALIISPATEEEVRSGEIGRRLRHFNYGDVGENPEVQPIRLNARGSDDQVVGGIRAIVAFYWLRVEVLFVDESVRGTGMARHCWWRRSGWPASWGQRTQQSKRSNGRPQVFYKKHGYVEAARLDGYVNGYYLAIMRKAL